MNKRVLKVAVVALAVGSIQAVRAEATGSCPVAVTESVNKAHAKSTIRSCKQEKEDGRLQYEVKIKTSDGQPLELDVAPDGAILLTEQKTDVAAVPAAVTSAFATRYPKTKVMAAEKQTHSDGKVTYELAFKVKSKRKESTFDENGAFVSQE